MSEPPTLTETEPWSRAVAANEPVTLTTQELDTLIGVIFEMHSALFSMISANYKQGANTQESVENTNKALEQTRESLKRTSSLFSDLIARQTRGDL